MNWKLASAEMNQDNLMPFVFLLCLYIQKLLSIVKNGIAKILLKNSLPTEKTCQIMTRFPRSVAFLATKMLMKNSMVNIVPYLYRALPPIVTKLEKTLKSVMFSGHDCMFKYPEGEKENVSINHSSHKDCFITYMN